MKSSTCVTARITSLQIPTVPLTLSNMRVSWSLPLGFPLFHRSVGKAESLHQPPTQGEKCEAVRQAGGEQIQGRTRD